MPPLSDEEFAALKTDIERRGVLVPVECDSEGNVLDGHHRIRACAELGVAAWDRIVRTGLLTTPRSPGTWGGGVK